MWIRDTPLPSRGIVPVRLAAGWILASRATRLALAGVPDLVTPADLSSPIFLAIGDAQVRAHPLLLSNVLVGCALAAGIGLLLGAFTRPAAMLGVLVCTALFAAAPDAAARDAALLLGAACLGCAVTPAGLRLGLDAHLVGRLPYWLTWTPPAGLRVTGSRSLP